MLKVYLTSKNISIYKLAKNSHVPYSTLNDLVNHKLPVDNIKSGQLKAIADTLALDMNTVYDLCKEGKIIKSDHFDIYAGISVAHKTYYLNFERNGKIYKCELLPVKKDATAYLETLAVWKLDEILNKLELEETYEAIYS